MKTENLIMSIACVAMMLLQLPAMAATYYVATTGKDTNAGSQASPWLTMQHGVSKLQPGDTLIAAKGSYTGFTSGYDASGDYGPVKGTATSPIIIMSDPSLPDGAAVIAKRSQKTEDGIDFENANGTCDYVTIRGFAVTNGDGLMQRSGIRLTQSTGCKILNCAVSKIIGFGITTSFTTDCVIDHNSVSGTVGSGSKGHGIYVANSAVRPVVSNNTIASNGGEGLHMNGDTSQGLPGNIVGATVTGNVIDGNVEVGINCDGAQNSLFQNNLIYGNQAHGIALYRQDAANASTGNRILNNTIYQVGQSGAAIELVNGATGNTVEDNILFGGTAGDLVAASDSRSGLLSDYNIVAGKFGDYTGNIVTLAVWQSATGQDKHSIASTPAAVLVAPTAKVPSFALAVNSPAIGTGTPTGTNVGYAAAGISSATQPIIPPASPATQPDPAMAQLQSQLDAASAQIATLTSQLNTATAQVITDASQTADLNSQLVTVQADASAKAQTISQLQSKIAAAMSALGN